MDKEIYYQEHPLFYRVTGKGKPVIFLHGLSEDGEIWQLQTAVLQHNNLLIVPDLPGSGRSGSLANVSMEAMADAIKAVLYAEGIKECVMIGHSMGGYIVLAFAARYPQFLTAFGLFHSTAYEDTEEKKASRRKNIQFIGMHGTHEYLKQSIPSLFSEQFKTAHPDVIANLIERYKNFDPDCLAAYNNAMMLRPDRTEILKKFVKPVLFIIGRQDNAIPFADSLKLCHLPALSYIHIFNNSAHMGMLEEAEKSNDALKLFLQDVS